jgi:hypothetical protein
MARRRPDGEANFRRPITSPLVPVILLIRCFAPAADLAVAEAFTDRLHGQFAGFAVAPATPPERYWKIPAWYEHTIRIEPASEKEFEAVLAMAKEGWHHLMRDGECSAVWNATPGASFLQPEITWAELLLIHDPSGGQEP